MRNILSIILVLSILTSCIQNNCLPGINKRPMYGSVKKCPEQIKADNSFLDQIDQIFLGDRSKASQERVVRAWEYFHKSHSDSAMIRFNQAWLLDSTNASVYWGYGSILGQQQKFDESLIYLEKSLILDAENSNVWLAASTSYGNLFYKSDDSVLLDKSIQYLKKSVELDPRNAAAFGQLTSAYTYYMQKDSARKYMAITDSLDPTAVNPEVREIIKKYVPQKGMDTD